MALPATEAFTTANDPLTTSANWGQPGATTDSGEAAGGKYGDANTNTSDKSAYWAPDAFANDHYSQIKLVTVDTAADERLGVVLRVGSGNEGLLIRFRTKSVNSDFEAYRWDSTGSRIALTGNPYSPSATFQVGDIMRGEISGSTLTLKIDYGAGFITETTWDASAGPASGSAGCYIVAHSAQGVGNTEGDDWEGGNLAGGSTIAPTGVFYGPLVGCLGGPV